MPRQQGCRMAARQRGMGVDDVNRVLAVEARHLCQQARIEPSPRARQAQIPGICGYLTQREGADGFGSFGDSKPGSRQ